MPPLWRWTSALVHALTNALCPAPSLIALVSAAASGELSRYLNDAPRRRITQAHRLRVLLARWVLG
jgi:hypothetical protein